MSDSASPWPKRGLAGKTHAARTYAEREGLDANDLQTLTVGWRAFNDDRDVADVWREVLEQ